MENCRFCSYRVSASTLAVFARWMASILSFAPANCAASSAQTAQARARCFSFSAVSSCRPTGRIVFDGKDITRAQPFERARLGIAVKVQSLGVFQDLTVDHNLRIPLMRRFSPDEVPRAIDQLLDQIGLRGLNGIPARMLSHGQKQWLALGMALAMEPKLLLLDEPTAGMSAEETGLTTRIIRLFNAKGSSVMVIEHDMAFVRRLEAPVIVMHLGRVFLRGTFSEVEVNEEVRHLYLGTRRKRRGANLG